MRIHSALDDIFAGQNGPLPEDLKFQHTDQGDTHRVTAIHPHDGPVGHLWWWKEGEKGDHHVGEVQAINVKPEYQRRGVASAMWNYAHSQSNINPKPAHSGELSDQGRAWSRSVGRPEDDIDRALGGEW